jgi:hypothetical protein
MRNALSWVKEQQRFDVHNVLMSRELGGCLGANEMELKDVAMITLLKTLWPRVLVR